MLSLLSDITTSCWDLSILGAVFYKKLEKKKFYKEIGVQPQVILEVPKLITVSCPTKQCFSFTSDLLLQFVCLYMSLPLPFTFLTSFSSSCALAFLIPALKTHKKMCAPLGQLFFCTSL